MPWASHSHSLVMSLATDPMCAKAGLYSTRKLLPTWLIPRSTRSTVTQGGLPMPLGADIGALWGSCSMTTLTWWWADAFALLLKRMMGQCLGRGGPLHLRP
jgi:hypothetical protein